MRAEPISSSAILFSGSRCCTEGSTMGKPVQRTGRAAADLRLATHPWPSDRKKPWQVTFDDPSKSRNRIVQDHQQREVQRQALRALHSKSRRGATKNRRPARRLTLPKTRCRTTYGSSQSAGSQDAEGKNTTPARNT